MNTQRIEILLAKYEQGLTSINEEHELREFFKGDAIPAHLLPQKKFFDYLDEAAKEQPADSEFEERLIRALTHAGKPQSKGRVRKLITMASIAATLALLISFGLMYQAEPRFEDTYDNPELAYFEAREALMKVSSGLNAGEEEISKVEMLNMGLKELESISAFKKGMQTLEKIGVLNSTQELETKNE